MFRYQHNLLPKFITIFFKQALRFIATVLDFLNTTETTTHELGPKNFLFIVLGPCSGTSSKPCLY